MNRSPSEKLMSYCHLAEIAMQLKSVADSRLITGLSVNTLGTCLDAVAMIVARDRDEVISDRLELVELISQYVGFNGLMLNGIVSPVITDCCGRSIFEQSAEEGSFTQDSDIVLAAESLSSMIFRLVARLLLNFNGGDASSALKLAESVFPSECDWKKQINLVASMDEARKLSDDPDFGTKFESFIKNLEGPAENQGSNDLQSPSDSSTPKKKTGSKSKGGRIERKISSDEIEAYEMLKRCKSPSKIDKTYQFSGVVCVDKDGTLQPWPEGHFKNLRALIEYRKKRNLKMIIVKVTKQSRIAITGRSEEPTLVF